MKIKGMRWWIIVLLFLAAVLNYIDRQTLSALAPTIQADLDMDDQAYANVINIFLIAYTIAYLISGRVADKVAYCCIPWCNFVEFLPIWIRLG
jgi:ACS family hexuronate transporter-like MFS transporter